MEELGRNNDSGTHGPEHAQRTHTRPGEADGNAMYVLPFAVIIGMLILSMAIYFSAGGIISAIDAKDFSAKGNFNSPNTAALVPSPAAPSAPGRAAPSVPSAGGCGIAPSGPGAAPSAPAAITNVDINGRPVEGSPNAKVTIVEFSEHLCPYSKRAQSTVAQIMKDYDGKVKHVYMHKFIHGEPPKKSAVAAECAADQGKFWEYTSLVFSDQKADADSLNAKAVQLNLDMAKFSACLASPAKLAEVERQDALGSQYGVGGTPTFFINGKMIVGAQPYENFKALIDAELAK